VKPFVLVHGAGGGGWNWDRVAPLLRAAGHERPRNVTRLLLECAA